MEELTIVKQDRYVTLFLAILSSIIALLELSSNRYFVKITPIILWIICWYQWNKGIVKITEEGWFQDNKNIFFWNDINSIDCNRKFKLILELKNGKKQKVDLFSINSSDRTKILKHIETKCS
jgi:hypothetical protein